MPITWKTSAFAIAQSRRWVHGPPMHPTSPLLPEPSCMYVSCYLHLDASSCPGTRHTWLRSILRSSHHLQPVAKENIPNKKDAQQYYLIVASINNTTSSSSGLLRLIPTNCTMPMVPTFAINPQTVTITTVRSTWLVDHQLRNQGN